MDTVEFITRFEDGEVSDEEFIDGFQALIDSGLAWQLQGTYGRIAVGLIESGVCHPGK